MGHLDGGDRDQRDNYDRIKIKSENLELQEMAMNGIGKERKDIRNFEKNKTNKIQQLIGYKVMMGIGKFEITFRVLIYVAHLTLYNPVIKFQNFSEKEHFPEELKMYTE